MNAKQLKNSLLQHAIQGRLVPQDPDDEPADVLLQRIRAEKEQLIKEGKIKKQKPLPPITEEEKPFAIPDSWQWVRLGEIGYWTAGATPARTNKDFYEDGSIPWLKTGDLTDGYIENIPENITELALKKCSVVLLPADSVLIAMYGATIGKVGILKFPATTNQACCGCIAPESIYNKWIFYYLLSQKTNFQKRGEGGAQPNISKEKIIITLMPLPPLAEQQRIVARLEELLPDVEAYGTAQERLTTLESSFPQQLRKSLLQEAIQGRLVPQNPDDEPADVLLQRIRAEKEQLIKEGKIKKQKPLPPITEEEKPFAIPDSWQWVRLGDLAARINYGFTASASMHGDIKFLRITDINIKTNAVNWNSVPFCTIDKNKINSYLLLPNDILIARTGGTIGKFYIVDKKIPKSVFASYLIRISLIKNITTKYIGIFLSSPAYWSQIIDSSMGTGQPNVNSIALASLKLPFPPLAEQQRIVARLEELLPLCDGLLSAGGKA